MEILTKSDVVGIAADFGFMEIVGAGRYLGSSLLVPLCRANSRRVLDCCLKDGIAHFTSGRFKDDAIPDEKTLLAGVSASTGNELRNEVLPAFAEAWDKLPRNGTEAVGEVKRRIGQDRYREGQMKLWDGACALTGVDVKELLVASHAVPWKDEDDVARTDPYNGFLFEARVDKLFDKHLISFEDDGRIMISSAISPDNRTRLALDETMKLRKVYPENLPYLRKHRRKFLSMSSHKARGDDWLRWKFMT